MNCRHKVPNEQPQGLLVCMYNGNRWTGQQAYNNNPDSLVWSISKGAICSAGHMHSVPGHTFQTPGTCS